MEQEVYKQAIERLREWMDSIQAIEILREWMDSMIEMSPPWEEYALLAARPIPNIWYSKEIDFYVWYFDKKENQYIFMFGRDEPDRESANWTEENFFSAYKRFCNYKGEKEQEYNN